MTTMIKEAYSPDYWYGKIQELGIDWLRTMWRTVRDLRDKQDPDENSSVDREACNRTLLAMNDAGARWRAEQEAGTSEPRLSASVDSGASAGRPGRSYEVNSPANAGHPDATSPRGAGITEDGMYRTADGTIFKVQAAVHGSGRLYAKKLVVEREPVRDAAGKLLQPAEIKFVYAPGMVMRLQPEDRLTKEQAKAFGALYGTCVRCGRTLTLEESIERMMGKTCFGKMRW